MPPVLWVLLAGNFVIGSGVMAVPATLDDISRSTGVSIAGAGQLITAAAAIMCVGAPLLAALVAGWDRRRLLTLTMAWWGVLHLAGALAPSYAWLLPLRMLAVVSPAIFTPQAAACVGLLVPIGQRGRAIAFVFLGWSVASVLGMPLNAFVGGLWGWRAAFAMVGVLALGCTWWVWRAMPDGVRPAALSRAAWGQAFRSPALMLCITVTVLFSAGQFVLFAYFAPYFRERLGATPSTLGLLFLWFGAFGLLGNLLVSRFIDRIGAGRAVLLGTLGMAAMPAAVSAGNQLGPGGHRPGALGPGLLLIQLGTAGAAGGHRAGTGQRLGGPEFLGALRRPGYRRGHRRWLISRGAMDQLHWVGLAGQLAAIAASILASRASSRQVGG